jgi:hypothetical protein
MTPTLPITLFTLPKAFVGHTAVIQRNAVRSWAELGAEVILLGDEAGIADAAAAIGARHHAVVARNERGTPLVSDAFRLGQDLASHSLVGYVNADIVLMDDFAAAVRILLTWRGAFLLTGRRWNLDVCETLPPGPCWSDHLRRQVARRGQQADEWWLDYFVFPRGLISTMPALAVGRASWDNWLLYDFRRRGIAVVDASSQVMVVHQNHDYAHLADPRVGWRGRESDGNLALLGGRSHAYNLADATHVLRANRVCRRFSLQPLRRRLGFHAGFRGPRGDG